MPNRRRFGKAGVQPWLCGTALFIGVLLCYVINMPRFDMVDEIDVFWGGALLSRGADVYAGFTSQHMPFSYYFAMIPALFGAKTMDQYRLGFYVMLSLVWAGNWAHHRRHLPGLMLVALPFLYLGQLNLVFMGTLMLSDHWQGVGMAILLEEMLRYDKTGHIELSSAVWISAAIVMSFGCAFVSAYGVAAVCGCVVLMQLSRYLRAEKTQRPELGSTLVREDLRLVSVCLAPFAVLVIWYALTGNLQRFIDYAYTINVDVYSKYMGGYGSDPGGTFFKIFADYLTEIRWVLPNFFQLKSLPQLLLNFNQLMRIGCTLCMAGALLWRRRWLMGLSVVLVTILSGPRGAVRDSYHAMAIYCVSTVSMAWCLSWAVSQWRKHLGGKAAALIALGCAAVVMAPLLQDATHIPSIPKLVSEKPNKLDVNCVNEIARPGDLIQSMSLGDSDVQVMTDLLLGTCSGAASTPWTYEFHDAGKRQLEAMKTENTRFILYQPDMEVWGYRNDEFAAETVQFIRDNFTNLCWNLYVPSREYEEIWRTLTDKGYLLGTLGETTGRALNLGEMLASGESVSQTLTVSGGECVGIEIYMANYYGANPGGVTVTVTDLDDGSIVSSSHVAADQIYDNHYMIAPCSAVLKAGGYYEITMTADEVAGQTRLVPYYTNRACDDKVYATAGRARTDYCMAVQLRYLPQFAAADGQR